MKKKDEINKEELLKKVMESGDTDAMAKIYAEYMKMSQKQIEWAEILKILAILTAAGISAATQIYVAKLVLTTENNPDGPGIIKSKAFPFKTDIKVTRF
jgi:hypothetical protein